MPRLPVLQIPPAPAGSTRTPQQKRFNTLIRQIEQSREALAAWNENIPLYRQAHSQLLVPLRKELQAAFLDWLFALDVLVDRKGWTNSERATLRDVICEGAQDVLLARGDDAQVKALFDKHSDVDFDTGQRELTLAMKALAEEVTGLDLGDDEIHDDAVLFERMRESLAQKVATEQAERDARAARRPKTAAQQKREAEAQQATQSVREIYRKLASSLHPDRETDERERAAKTELMQRVNQAYAAGDLLALLELQLRI
jgi:flagellar hook-associated protein FlgK